MRKLLSLILVLCIALPTMAAAAGQKNFPPRFKASDTLTADEKQAFDGISYARLGAEFLYANADLSEASFTRTKACKVRYTVHYISLCQKVFKRRPGTCPCGKALVPAIKFANAWYQLSRNEQGSLTIQPAAIDNSCHGDSSCTSAKPESKNNNSCASCGSCSK